MSAAETWIMLSPLLTAVGAAVVGLLLDAFDRPGDAARWCAITLTGASVLAFSLGWGYEPTALFADTTAGSASLAGSFMSGGFVSNIAGVLFALSAIILAADSPRIARENAGPVAALVAISAAAAAILAGTRDLVLFVLALETLALCGYAFVASARSKRSDEAAMKYFVQGAVMTGFLLYGLAVLYGLFGVGFQYGESFIGSSPTSGAVLFVLTTLAAAVAFKMSAFPFHWWAPDALETAPAGPAAMLASVPKMAMLVAAPTLFAVLLAPHASAWGPIFAIMSVASIVFGNLAALRQTNYQRMLAYSGIAQAGYAFAGFVALANLLEDQGAILFPTKLFALTYGLAVVGAFLVAAAVRDHDPDWDGSIAGMAGLASRRPALAFAAAVCLLSLTGIPLTAGFWGKFTVFWMVVGSEAAWLAVVGFVGSVVSFGYYGAVLRAMYLDAPVVPAVDSEEASPADVSVTDPTAARAAFLVSLTVIALGLLPIFWWLGPLQTFLGP